MARNNGVLQVVECLAVKLSSIFTRLIIITIFKRKHFVPPTPIFFSFSPAIHYSTF